MITIGHSRGTSMYAYHIIIFQCFSWRGCCLIWWANLLLLKKRFVLAGVFLVATPKYHFPCWPLEAQKNNPGLAQPIDAQFVGGFVIQKLTKKLDQPLKSQVVPQKIRAETSQNSQLRFIPGSPVKPWKFPVTKRAVFGEFGKASTVWPSPVASWLWRKRRERPVRRCWRRWQGRKLAETALGIFSQQLHG